jgi:K+-sensing histidine kinase KdpD
MQSNGAPLAHNAELELALSQGLDIPLRALRASMESMSNELTREGDSAVLLSGVLEEVERLGRNVRELVEFASAPRPMPLACTVDEILISARSALSTTKRRRVTIAHAEEGSTLCVDGPLLARSLQRFLENALEAGSEHVLLIAHREDGATRFTVFDDAPQSFDAEWAVPAFHSTKRNHLGLGLSLAERDVALLDGSIEFSNCPRGNKCVAVFVPDHDPAKATNPINPIESAA